MSKQSRHSVLAVRTNRSANAFARGARTGVLMTRAPIDLITSSKGPVNFESRSRIKNVTTRPFVLKPGCEVPRLLGDPGPNRVCRDARQEDLATLEVDEEQHVETTQCDGICGEEVTHERPGRLSLEELR